MSAEAAVLPEGATAFDHGAEDAPVHGPVTLGAAVLEPLTFSELRALGARMNVVRADYMVAAEGRWQRAGAHEAAWDDATALIDDIAWAYPYAMRADHERRMAELGGAR